MSNSNMSNIYLLINLLLNLVNIVSFLFIERNILKEGYPAYTTSCGWLGYPDEKIRQVDIRLFFYLQIYFFPLSK